MHWLLFLPLLWPATGLYALFFRSDLDVSIPQILFHTVLGPIALLDWSIL
jgi:hypothetical protein